MNTQVKHAEHEKEASKTTDQKAVLHRRPQCGEGRRPNTCEKTATCPKRTTVTLTAVLLEIKQRSEAKRVGRKRQRDQESGRTRSRTDKRRKHELSETAKVHVSDLQKRQKHNNRELSMESEQNMPHTLRNNPESKHQKPNCPNNKEICRVKRW